MPIYFTGVEKKREGVIVFWIRVRISIKTPIKLDFFKKVNIGNIPCYISENYKTNALFRWKACCIWNCKERLWDCYRYRGNNSI